VNCPRCDTPLPTESKFCLNCGTNISGDTAAGDPASLEIGPDVEQALRAELAGMYDIERELGRGGMGAVFLATERQLGRKVAIKVLPPAFTFGAGAIERFKREARTSATLDHPHVIPIYRVAEKDTLLWYAMKYVEGHTLTDVLEREPTLSFTRAADVVRQVAEALQYAHDRGVIHRDIKPGNILVGPDGWIVVTDFGIAKATGTVSITGSGSMLGTPHYMSPEQCSGMVLTPAADQYALGVVAYQMLAGELPFGGASVVDVIKKHCFDPVPSLNARRPDTPPQLAAVVERALAKEAEQRFPSVKHFADAFGRAARGEHLNAATVSGPVTPRVGLTSLPLTKSRRGLVAGAVVGAVAIATAVILLRPTPHSQPLPAPSPTAGTAPRDADATAVPTAVARPGVLALRGVPRGATVRVDGRVVSVPAAVEPGAHSVTVTAPGFQRWQASITAAAGDTVRRDVRLLRDTATAAVPAPGATGIGYITIGSRPLSRMTINGRPAASNPVSALEVPAGLVSIRFTVTDSTGTWTVDTTVAVGPGERHNVGFVRLVRR
jgi:predicted Ser/Thr protein kinase